MTFNEFLHPDIFEVGKISHFYPADKLCKYWSLFRIKTQHF
jgi:hypothetical protein